MECNKSLPGEIEDNETVRNSLTKACRALAWYRMQDSVFNHVSGLAKSRDGDGVVVLTVPYGIMWQEVTPEGLIGIDRDTGKVIEGQGTVSEVAMGLHLTIHRKRPDIRAAFHAHPINATSLCCLKDFKVRCLHTSSMGIIDDIAYDRDFDGIRPRSMEFDRIADCLGESKRILMIGNHGVVTVGESIAKAFDLMYTVEQTCQIQIKALSTGLELNDVSLERAKYYQKQIAIAYKNVSQHLMDSASRVAQMKSKF